MAITKILDCTLRDGGYCNGWDFGEKGSREIVESLDSAGVDIVECGFLTDRLRHRSGLTQFNSVREISEILPASKGDELFVAMANYGEFDPDCLPVREEAPIDGIRVAFSKRDRFGALEMCREIAERGYLVFVQAMVSLSYSDDEFLDLIRRVNEIEPYAFYIVDSFGVMKREDMLRFFYLIDHNLSDGISIGFHSHNNMQLAYANAQTLIDMRQPRELIIDSSIYGMGRGAGNLCTELLVGYLNDGFGGRYALKPLLKVIDDVLAQFYYRNPWGYSLPNYLSAAHNAHPNYAGWLADKDTLTVEGVNDIFEMMDEDHRLRFDRGYIERLYEGYMAGRGDVSDGMGWLRGVVRGREVLVICPGMSSDEEADRVVAAAGDGDPLTVSVNFVYPHLDTDLIFVSNIRRFERLPSDVRSRTVVTSNVAAGSPLAVADYTSLLNDNEAVRDNAALMLIRLLAKLGARKILLAGMDGYSSVPEENYFGDRVSKIVSRKQYAEVNRGMCEILRELSREIDISFLTEPRHVTL